GVVTLPIACGKQLEGLITVKDIVTAYMDVYDSKILSMSKTSYRSIVDTLDGELIVGHAERDYVNTGKIIIAAGSPETIEDVIDDGDIVITSNRYEAQFCAIQMNADMVIICNGSAVSKTIKKLAQEKNCVIITTPHDTYSTARLINQSAPVSYFMRSQGLVGFKKDDFIEDVKKVMAQKRYRDFPVLDRQGNYCGMLSRRFLLNMNKKQLILVDHNEKSQAIDGLEEAEILEIIDHHRLGALETMAPVFFRNQPVGCTATIIYKMYKENSVPFTKEMAGILCAAILSDTLAYRSPTCTEEDKNAGEDLAKIADISPVQFAKEMFGAGSKLAEKPANEIFNHDFKRFSINDIDFGV
ncbi:MAG: putative manganese-dependent inorganic diphosphatase, partial [Anaerovorax sp.]